MTIGIFLFMGMTSDEVLDESTNVSVNLKPSDCEARPPFTGVLEVTINNPGPFGGGGSTWGYEVFLSNQKINDTIECHSFYRHSIEEEGVLSPGTSDVVMSPSFIHDNKGDLWRVQIRAKPSQDLDWEYGEVKVVFYDQTKVTFTLGSLPPL
jgi:hypothetical protein